MPQKKFTATDIHGIISDICNDRTSGSREIVRHTIDQLKIVVKTAPVTELRKIVQYLLDEIIKCHPNMEIIRSLRDELKMVLSIGFTRESLYSLVENFDRMMRDDVLSISRRLYELVEKPSVFITLTMSETVHQVLKFLADRDKITKVIVAESRPRREGVILARLLSESNIRVELIVDAAIDFFISEADIAIIGADRIYRYEGVLNKIGSRMLGISSLEKGIPFYVVAETRKYTGSKFKRSEIKEQPETEVLDAGNISNLKPRNVYFELVENRLITAIITEDGILYPNKNGGRE